MFSQEGSVIGFERIFTHDFLTRIIEEKDYLSVELVLQFFTSFKNRFLGLVETHEKTKVHAMYKYMSTTLPGTWTVRRPQEMMDTI